MEVIVRSGIVLLAILNVFFLPGYGFVRKVVRSHDPIEIAVLSLGLGLLGGSFVYFAVAALLRTWMTPTLVLATANVLNFVFLPQFLGDIRRWRQSRAILGTNIMRPRSQLLTCLIATIVATVLLLARYDASEFHLTCTNYPVAYVTGIPMGDGTVANHARNDILWLNMEEREGNVAVIAATPALFPFFGYRLYYALINLVTCLTAFLLGERIFLSFRAGLLTGGLFLVYPYLASIVELDQNLNVLAASLLLFHLLVRKPNNPAVAGFCFSVAFGCRHIVLPGALGPLIYLATVAKPHRGILRFLAGFVPASSMWALHHQLAFGRIFYEETYRHFAQSFTHEILGFRFELPAILQWPFVPELLRSPYNGLPQALLFPVAQVQQAGTVLAALGIIGALWMFRARRRELWLLGLWAAPIAAILMIQGHSSEVTKLRLAINIFGPLLLWVAAGIVWMRRTKHGVTAIVTTALLATGLTIAIRSLAHIDFPVDPREYLAHPDIPPEGRAEYDLVRQEATRVDPHPALLFAPLRPLIEPGRFSQIARELVDDHFEDHPETIPQSMARYFQPAEWKRIYEPHLRWKPDEPLLLPRREPHFLRIDLSDRPSRHPDFVKVVEDAPTQRIDLTVLTERLYLQNRKVGAHEGAVDFLLLRQGSAGQEFILFFLINRPHGFYAEPPRRVAGDELFLEINKGARIFFVHFLHSMPLIAIGWDIEVYTGPGGRQYIYLESRKI